MTSYECSWWLSAWPACQPGGARGGVPMLQQGAEPGHPGEGDRHGRPVRARPLRPRGSAGEAGPPGGETTIPAHAIESGLWTFARCNEKGEAPPHPLPALASNTLFRSLFPVVPDFLTSKTGRPTALCAVFNLLYKLHRAITHTHALRACKSLLFTQDIYLCLCESLFCWLSNLVSVCVCVCVCVCLREGIWWGMCMCPGVMGLEIWSWGW